MTKLGIGYYPIVHFRATDRSGYSWEATFDEVLCQTKGEALQYARKQIKELQAEIPEDCDGITFWTDALDTTKMSEKDRAIMGLLLEKGKTDEA